MKIRNTRNEYQAIYEAAHASGATHAQALELAERITERFTTGYWSRPNIITHAGNPLEALHESKENPALWCYFPNLSAALNDKPRQIRPGKYIAAMLPTIGIDADDATVQSFVEAAKEIEYATIQILPKPTADQLEKIYTNYRDPGRAQSMGYGVHTSCMRYPADRYDSHAHPVRVYDKGDIGIIYSVDEDGKTYARTLYNPENNGYVRVYYTPRPGESHAEAMQQWESRLEERGFSQDSRALEGCRIRLEECDGTIIAPYIDGRFQNVDERGRIGDEGPYECNQTNGLANNEDEDTVTCGHCGSRIRLDDGDYYIGGDDYFCDDVCFHAAGWRICQNDRCGEAFYSDYGTMTEDGHDYCCDACAERAGYAQCTYCDAWHEADEMICTEDGESLYCCEEHANNDGYTECERCYAWIHETEAHHGDDEHGTDKVLYCSEKCRDIDHERIIHRTMRPLPGLEATS